MADGSLRVVFVQPSLAKYRVPVYRELAGRAGIDFRLVYAQSPGITNVDADGFRAELSRMRIAKVRGRSLIWNSAQVREATKKRCDVLCLSWNAGYLSLVPALLRARASGVGTIVWGHGYSKNESPRRARARERVAKLADVVMFYNHTAARRYVERGWAPSRVHVALNALDQGPIQRAREHWLSRPDELRAFQVGHALADRPTIVFVSRLLEENRADLLLRAAAKLRERFDTLRVVIIGKGPAQAALESLAGELDLGSCVTFTGAIFDEMELAPWMLSSHVFCYPENIGLSILHAMGYGLPVVTSDKIEGQNPEIEALRDGENGLLYAHGDLDAMIETLARVLGDGVLRSRLSASAHTTATQQFTLANMVDGMEGAIRAAAARRA
ncbi:MAG: glycosyltransferase family 4 protein [Phycisphaerales bacterium]|jgi:glycosyltransferase involved in cell wall biosynthesis|nr:glycosyltransferase family 4 protein [Phycisphaerales bacterium]